MSDRIAFTVLGTPCPQGSMKAFIDKAGNANMTSDNAKMKPWRQQVGWSALEARAKDGMHEPWGSDVPVRLTAFFVLARPKTCPKRRIYPTVKPDLDKLKRAVMDALKGVIYKDDAQVVEHGPTAKRYGLPERAEIIVEVVQ